MNLSEIRKELEPFIAADPIGVQEDGRYGSVAHLNVVGRTADGTPISLENGSPCADSDTWDVYWAFSLSRKRYAYLQRKKRELQRDQELNVELALAVAKICATVADLRERGEKRGIQVIPVPQEVQSHEPS